MAVAQAKPAAPEKSGPEFGFDARLRYEVNDPTAFGNGPQDGGGYLLWRIIPSVKLQFAPDWLAKVEIFAAGVSGRTGGARPNDRNDLDLTQAHVEWRPGGGNTFLRFGRQEIALGSGRLLAANDGANVRRRFDGVVGQVQRGDWTAIGAAAAVVQVRPGVFDDSASTDRLMLGAGIVHGDPSGSSEGLYALRTLSNTTSFGNPPDALERYTIGARFVRRNGSRLVEAEAIAQLGRDSQGREIRAWALAGEIRGEIAKVGSAALILGGKASIASGDRSTTDRVIGGFDPLFPNPAFTGSFPLIAPTNVAAINPSLSLQWPSGHRLGIDVAVMQRVTLGDAVYSFGGAPITATGDGRFVGALWSVTGAYQISPQLSINATASYLANGNYFAGEAGNTAAIAVNLNVSF